MILENAGPLDIVMNGEIAIYWGAEGRGVDYQLTFTDGATSTYSGSMVQYSRLGIISSKVN